MSDSIFSLIDNVGITTEAAELDVMIALSNSYIKESMMIQEGIKDELNSPVLGDSSENIVKRILMFIPRLIAKIIRMLGRLITIRKRQRKIFSREFLKDYAQIGNFDSAEDAEAYLKAKGFTDYEIRNSGGVKTIPIKRVRMAKTDVFYVIKPSFGGYWCIEPCVVLEAPTDRFQFGSMPSPGYLEHTAERIHEELKKIFEQLDAGNNARDVDTIELLKTNVTSRNNMKDVTWSMKEINLSDFQTYMDQGDQDVPGKVMLIMNEINRSFRNRNITDENLNNEKFGYSLSKELLEVKTTLLELAEHVAKWEAFISNCNDAVERISHDMKRLSKTKEIINDIKNA